MRRRDSLPKSYKLLAKKTFFLEILDTLEAKAGGRISFFGPRAKYFLGTRKKSLKKKDNCFNFSCVIMLKILQVWPRDHSIFGLYSASIGKWDILLYPPNCTTLSKPYPITTSPQGCQPLKLPLRLLNLTLKTYRQGPSK